MRYPGKLISLEGMDSVGKSTHLDLLKADPDFLDRYNIFPTTDPPSCLPWNKLQDAWQNGGRVAPEAETLLYLAARTDNSCRLFPPYLEAGTNLLVDRYTDSWLVYQSVRYADKFGSPGKALDAFLDLQGWFANFFVYLPDKTILITDTPEKTLQRSVNAGKLSQFDTLPIQTEVGKLYHSLADRFPERFIIIPNDDRTIEEVHYELRGELEKYLAPNIGGVALRTNMQ